VSNQILNSSCIVLERHVLESRHNSIVLDELPMSVDQFSWWHRILYVSSFKVEP